MTQLDNPYWDQVRDFAKPARSWLDPKLVVGTEIGGMGTRGEFDAETFTSIWEQRRLRSNQYCWPVPDPVTVDFVAEHSRGKMIDPMAGTGYWHMLLAQKGVDVVSSDLFPPGGDQDVSNEYHRHATQFVDVRQADAAEAVQQASPSRTLFLSWPPMTDAAQRTLHIYSGERLIYIGEGEGGCCADDGFFAELEQGWDEVATHLPVQYFGIHDVVLVFERRRKQLS